MSSMTGPVSAAKGKKNWEQLQQESEASEREGVQVRVTVLMIVMMICSDNDLWRVVLCSDSNRS